MWCSGNTDTVKTIYRHQTLLFCLFTPILKVTRTQHTNTHHTHLFIFVNKHMDVLYTYTKDPYFDMHIILILNHAMSNDSPLRENPQHFDRTWATRIQLNGRKNTLWIHLHVLISRQPLWNTPYKETAPVNTINIAASH